MPSLPPGKPSRLITGAVAGTLIVAATLSSIAVMLPSRSAASAGPAAARLTAVGQQAASAQQNDVMSPVQRLVAFDRVRFDLGEIQHLHDAALAKAAKAAARAAATQAAARRTATNAPSGTPQQIAQRMLSQFGWPSSQFSCLYPLWEHESGWNPTAQNPGSGAYGIPQSLPGSQMATAGADWQTKPATQIRWGLTYIKGRYGTPCDAWAHEQADNWY